MIVLREMHGLFADATRRQRLMLAALLAGMLGTVTYGCSWAGAVMGGLVPVKRNVTVVTHHVQEFDRLVVPRTPRKAYQPLANPKTACTGEPVVIEQISVGGWQGQKEGDNDVKTWLTVRPAGDDYTVVCDIGGDYSRGWHPGDLVRLYGGEIS